jgi:hypothetical protein
VAIIEMHHQYFGRESEGTIDVRLTGAIEISHQFGAILCV